MYELTIDANSRNLPQVQSFIESHLEEAGCPMKTMMQISMAVEEIFINVSSYAYAPGQGDVTVCIEFANSSKDVVITFKDHGIPYNPLAKDDPDVSLPAKDRKIGGLGIFLTKRVMDGMTYEYKDGQNILAMRKTMI